MTTLASGLDGWIAFARAPDGRGEGWAIFTVRADGTGPTPDGRFLAAWRPLYDGFGTTKSPGLIVMRRDGTPLRQIARGYVWGVDWQPRSGTVRTS